MVGVFVVATTLAALIGGAGSLTRAAASARVMTAATPRDAVSPIQHVVVIFQENHSFDNVLGQICVTDALECDGATTGLLHDGRRIALTAAPDIVPSVQHKIQHQRWAIDGGRMDGFDRIPGCGPYAHACYSQYAASEIPNLRTLAENYVISDRTFSEDPIPSWGGHIELVAGQLDGFQGAGPTDDSGSKPQVGGWGCDSGKDSPWKNPAKPKSRVVLVPACVPRPDGFGPYRKSPVKYVPTILDRLAGAGLSWKIYADIARKQSGYIWSVCPSFASCLYDKANHNDPNTNWEARDQFYADASNGTLPAYSAILPNYQLRQHTYASMLAGDHYIESLVQAVMDGPSDQWYSTVFFITYDDCGCFYDHVPPPPHSGYGIRVPMVIVSPQTKAAYVDHTVASFDSMLAFVEQNWQLPPLSSKDARAYDYCNSFIFTLPCTGAATGSANPAARAAARAAPRRVRLRPSRVPAASLRSARAHVPDPDDPT